MKNLGRLACCLVTAGTLLFSTNVFAQSAFQMPGGSNSGRAFTNRELKPKGQMMGEIYGVRSKLRDLRLQETRRPRDIQAAPVPTNKPGHARPSSTFNLNMNREKLEYTARSGGFLIEGQAGSQTNPSSSNNAMFWGPSRLGSTINTDSIDKMDPMKANIEVEDASVEWWEMNERSRTQRGGGFRTRFGSRQPAQMMQGGGGGGGTVGPPGGGGFAPQPGQNMPAGGGGGMMGGMGGMGGNSGGGAFPNMPGGDGGGMR